MYISTSIAYVGKEKNSKMFGLKTLKKTKLSFQSGFISYYLLPSFLSSRTRAQIFSLHRG